MGLMSHYGVSSAPIADSAPYTWMWANAAERLATAATPAQIGGKGFQSDIGRVFQLLSLTGGAPLRWGRWPALDCVNYRFFEPNPTSWDTLGLNVTSAGSISAHVPNGTSLLNNQVQAILASSASAGSLGIVSQGSAGPPMLAGLRIFREFGIRAVSASWRWFVGMGQTLITTNVDPATQTNLVGIGRGAGQTNVQVYHNDGAGAATVIDLGTDFPASVSGTLYQLELFAPFGGASVRYNLFNRSNNQEISGTLSANIPANTVPMLWQNLCCNNTDAIQVSLGLCYLLSGQVSV